MFCGFSDYKGISRNTNKKMFPEVDAMFGQMEMQLHSIAPTENADIVSTGDGKVEPKRRTKRHILDDWLRDGGRISGRIQTPVQKSEPPMIILDEGPTRHAEGTVLTNDNTVQHTNHVNPATRLARFLDRIPHDGGISIKVDDNIDLGILPEDDRMRVVPPGNATDFKVREISEDERVEYGFAPDGHFVGQEQDNKQVASRRSKRVEMRYNVNAPSTQDAHSDGIKDVGINDRNSRERQFETSNTANDEITMGDQRPGKNDPKAGVLSANIKKLFSNNPRGAYVMQK